jgi:hypothetical protein
VRKLSKATTIIVVAIALYFALVWGYDGLRILSSPTYGLDDGWRSQFVFSIGHLFNLGPIGLIKLAAFFGGLKFAVACICAFHIVDRLRSLSRGRTNTEILEAGLILVVAISIVSVSPGSLTDTADLTREHTLPLLFAALATGLCILERNKARREEETEIEPANLVDKKPYRRLRAFIHDTISAVSHLSDRSKSPVVSPHFGRASCRPRSGGCNLPERLSLTACTSARAAFRTSS